MTPLDALRQAVLECQQFPYRAEQPGRARKRRSTTATAIARTRPSGRSSAPGRSPRARSSSSSPACSRAASATPGLSSWRAPRPGGRTRRPDGARSSHPPLRIPLDREPVPRQVRLREGRVTVVERWLLRTVAVALLLAAVYVTAREMADWIIWRRDVNAAIQQLAQRLAAPPPGGTK